MGVTITRRQIAFAALTVVLLLVARWWSRPREVVETATAEHPLVIEAPRLRVVSGADTFSIMGPAAFTYVGLDPADENPPERLVDAGRELVAAVADAGPGLEALGVRVVSVDQPPVPLDVTPEADAAAGPPFEPASVGVLLADPQGRVLRLHRVAGGAALVCAAARTFGREPPPAFAPACR